MSKLLSYYLPKLSLVLFVEVFSFFFLRLYKESLDEIKYFQNELTNAELRFLAMEAALLEGGASAVLASVIRGLAATERNFILKKGESTVDLRKGELDLESHKQVLDAFTSLLGKNIKNKKK